MITLLHELFQANRLSIVLVTIILSLVSHIFMLMVTPKIVKVQGLKFFTISGVITYFGTSIIGVFFPLVSGWLMVFSVVFLLPAMWWTKRIEDRLIIARDKKGNLVAIER